MLRILDGIVYEGKPAPGRYRLAVHELGEDQCEAVVTQCVDWRESHVLDPEWQATEAELREKAEANAKRASRRAATRCRRLVKAMGCDALLTLTYRANMTDEGACRAHLKEFVRRIRRTIPGFAYVSCLERQKRGAWHVHLACHRLPRAFFSGGVRVKSWDVVRAVWRGVVGDLGGNVDLSARRAKFSPAKLASYLSKYLLKAFTDGAAWSKRLTHSRHELPAPVVAQFEGASLGELIELAYAFACGAGRVIAGAHLDAAFGWFYLATERRPP